MSHYTRGQEMDVARGLKYLEEISGSLLALVEQGERIATALERMVPPEMVLCENCGRTYPEDPKHPGYVEPHVCLNYHKPTVDVDLPE